jgi:TolB-like protein
MQMVKSLARATAALALVAAPVLAQQPDTRPTLAVLPFVNSAIGQSYTELAPLSKGIADLLLIDLAQNTGIRVVERENIDRILAEQNLARDGRVDDATAARIGKLLGAKHMLTGTFVTDGRGNMRLTMKSVDSETG